MPNFLPEMDFIQVALTRNEAKVIREALEARRRQIGRYTANDDGSVTETEFQCCVDDLIVLMKEVEEKPVEVEEKPAGHENTGSGV